MLEGGHDSDSPLNNKANLVRLDLRVLFINKTVLVLTETYVKKAT